MRLILVRHGETEDNVNHIVQGHQPGKLTRNGREQAGQVARRLAAEHIDAIYVSDLARTKDTALPIIEKHPGVPVVYDARIRERNFGIHEGGASGSVRRGAEEAGVAYEEYAPAGGESLRDVRRRMVAFVDELQDKHTAGTVLIVSHGGPITNLLLHLFNVPDDEYAAYHPPNTAVTIIDIEQGKKPILHLLNCTKHLGPS